VISRVSADKDSRNLSTVVDSVDFVFVAEDIVVVLNGGSCLFGKRSVDRVGERSNSVKSSTINSMGMVGVLVV